MCVAIPILCASRFRPQALRNLNRVVAARMHLIGRQLRLSHCAHRQRLQHWRFLLRYVAFGWCSTWCVSDQKHYVSLLCAPHLMFTQLRCQLSTPITPNFRWRELNFSLGPYCMCFSWSPLDVAHLALTGWFFCLSTILVDSAQGSRRVQYVTRCNHIGREHFTAFVVQFRWSN